MHSDAFGDVSYNFEGCNYHACVGALAVEGAVSPHRGVVGSKAGYLGTSKSSGQAGGGRFNDGLPLTAGRAFIVVGPEMDPTFSPSMLCFRQVWWMSRIRGVLAFGSGAQLGIDERWR